MAEESITKCEMSVLVVEECAGGSIHLPHEVLREAGKDVYVNTLKSDGPDGGKTVTTMRVEDIIKHLREVYLGQK